MGASSWVLHRGGRPARAKQGMQNRKRQPVPAALFLFSAPAPLRKYPSAFGRLEKLDELRGRKKNNTTKRHNNDSNTKNGVFRFDGDHIRKLGIADLPDIPDQPDVDVGMFSPNHYRIGAAADVGNNVYP